MLGHKLAQVLGGDARFEVHCTVRRRPPATLCPPGATYHADIDVSRNLHQLRRLVSSLRPDVIVNAVGAVKQKDLASALEETFFVNGALPQLLPFLAAESDAKVVQFSTDCVFKGTRGGYVEDDTPDADDLYGRSKVCGEIAYGRHLTIRTSIIGFELGGHLGLLSWLFSHSPGSVVLGYSSAIFSGLPTCTLSRTVATLLASEDSISGLYHVASDPIDKCSLLSRIVAAFALDLRVIPNDAVSIDRSLDDTRFRRRTRTVRPAWDALIAELKADFHSLPYDSMYQSGAPS
jgi:dTDP-4-dehydrorhamnose reductase